MPRVFLVTGCSTGFGKILVQEILDNGDIYIATARKPETLSFDKTSSQNYAAIRLDVCNLKDIDSMFATAVEKFGRMDVVFNNAGYALMGLLKKSRMTRSRPR